jgi:hypothetical protein
MCEQAKTVQALHRAVTVIGPTTLLLYDKKKIDYLSLSLIALHVMIEYWGMEVELHSFLTSALVRGNWLHKNFQVYTSNRN